MRKTKQQIGFKLNELFKRGIFDEDFYEELEYILLSSDVGEETTEDVIDTLRENMRKDSVSDPKKANEYLKKVLTDILGEEKFSFNTPLRHHRGWGKRRGQNHHDRQACQYLRKAGQVGGDSRRRHLPRRRRRTA